MIGEGYNTTTIYNLFKNSTALTNVNWIPCGLNSFKYEHQDSEVSNYHDKAHFKRKFYHKSCYTR